MVGATHVLGQWFPGGVNSIFYDLGWNPRYQCWVKRVRLCASHRGTHLDIDFLKAAGANPALQAAAKTYGVSPEQLDAIVATVIPAFSTRIERNMLSRGGLSDLVAEIGRPAHSQIAAHPDLVASPYADQAGVGALDTLFGNKANSRSIAAQAALSSGVQQAIIQKLLPILASLVMAALSKSTQGGLGDIIKKLPDILGGGGPQPTPRGGQPSDTGPDLGGLGDIIKKLPDILGGGSDSQPAPRGGQSRQNPGQGSNPDLGGLGDILSKIPGMPGNHPQPQPQPQSQPQSPWGSGGRTAQVPVPSSDTSDTGFGGAGGGFGGGSPLPIPGDRIPGVNAPADNQYGNLPDIIRRGGQSVDGNDLGRAVRDKIGPSLGLPSGGILSWVIRFIVLRWGWGFVKRILSRALTGR